MMPEAVILSSLMGTKTIVRSITFAFFVPVLLAGCLRVKLPEVEVKPMGEGDEFTWTRAVDEALERHPDLEQARALVESAARSRDSAAGDYLPSVDGEFDRDRSRTTNVSPMQDSIALGISASQSLFNGFNSTGAYLTAKRNLEAAEFYYRETSASVRQRLRTAYVQVLQFKKLLEVNHRIATRRRSNAEMIRLRYDAGRENLGSALRAEAIAGQADYDVRATERQIESKSLLFGREIGGNFYLPVSVAGDLETLVPKADAGKPDLVKLAEETPRVQTLAKAAEALKAAIISAQSAVWPQVNGLLDYGYSGAKASQMRDSMLFGFAVTVPFFNGGKNIAAIRKARDDYEAAFQAARSARDARISELAEAWAIFQDALENVEVQRQFLKANRERAEIVRSEYTTGLAKFQDFDISEQEITDTEKNYVRSMANSLIVKASWDFLRGATLEEAKNAD